MYFCLFFLFDENKNINKQQVLIVYKAMMSKGIKERKKYMCKFTPMKTESLECLNFPSSNIDISPVCPNLNAIFASIG